MGKITSNVFHVFSSDLLNTDNLFSDMFNNGYKKIKMADLLRFFAFYVNIFTLKVR